MISGIAIGVSKVRLHSRPVVRRTGIAGRLDQSCFLQRATFQKATRDARNLFPVESVQFWLRGLYLAFLGGIAEDSLRVSSQLDRFINNQQGLNERCMWRELDG